MKNFKRLGRAGIWLLRSEIDRNSHLWNQITARQDTPGSPHHDTQAIFLRWAATQTVEAAFTEIPAIDYPALKSLPMCAENIKEFCRSMGVVKLGRVMIVNLLPGGHIDAHVDEGAYSNHYQRFHLSIESKAGNWFRCGDESIHMHPGQLWWFNHKIEHEVRNKSSTRRLHMIFDAVLRKTLI